MRRFLDNHGKHVSTVLIALVIWCGIPLIGVGLIRVITALAGVDTPSTHDLALGAGVFLMCGSTALALAFVAERDKIRLWWWS